MNEKEMSINELEELSKPIQEYLKTNYDVMCKVEISIDRIDVYRAEMGTHTDN